MKKIGVLNKDISEVIAGLGHMDMLVIGDAGLPIPATTRRIDVAISAGIPGFVDTVRAVSAEMQVQRLIVARETSTQSPHILESLRQLFPGVELVEVSHEELKDLSRKAVAVIRTGEFTPYANVVLVAGVVF